jgi:hypothetical protein
MRPEIHFDDKLPPICLTREAPPPAANGSLERSADAAGASILGGIILLGGTVGALILAGIVAFFAGRAA